MRVAIVHDYLTQFGGAERVLQALMAHYPHAPVFTLIYDRATLPYRFDERRIRTSFLQRLPGSRRQHRYFPLLMPLATEQFDFTGYDLIFSATHSFSKGIIVPASALHISYCFTPTRYVWDDSHRYVREFSRSALFQRFAPAGLSYIRLWDYFAAQRVDAYLTLSHYVARRIRKYYRRDATVIPPPVDVKRFNVAPGHQGYYLIVSRLVPYKRIDIAIAACEALGRPLLIAGAGPERAELERRAGHFTRFVGFVPEAELPALYQGARALLFPQEEDFGITTLEAAASGKPTIAYARGGAQETVVAGTTGLLFTEQSPRGLMTAIREFESRSWDAAAIRRHAEAFSASSFLRAIDAAVHTLWMSHQRTRQTRT